MVIEVHKVVVVVKDHKVIKELEAQNLVVPKVRKVFKDTKVVIKEVKVVKVVEVHKELKVIKEHHLQD